MNKFEIFYLKIKFCSEEDIYQKNFNKPYRKCISHAIFFFSSNVPSDGKYAAI